MWLQWVLQESGPAHFLCVYLTNVFSVRVGQVCQLHSDNFAWDAVPTPQVNLKAFKRHLACGKEMVPSVLKQLKRWRLKGITAPTVTRHAGARGKVQVVRRWTWPRSGFLFPARADAALPHWGYNTPGHELRKSRDGFIRKYATRFPSLLGRNPRIHSERSGP